jgi:general stress protein 26
MTEKPVHIPDQLREFLADEILCCLAVAMPEEAVHAAVLRYWCDTQNLNIYMSTSKKSEKMWWLRKGKTSVKTSIAIGLTHQQPYSLQMRGTLEVFDPQSDSYISEQYSKVASELDHIDDPNNVMIVFRPNWARYTDRVTDQKLMYPITL